jgi:hypothetical protein
MRLLTLRKKALITLVSENSGRFGNFGPVLAIHRDAGVSVPTVLLNNIFVQKTTGRMTHFFHYEHKCKGRINMDVWLSESDMPDTDGDHLVCPVCQMVGLCVTTVPQQLGTVSLINPLWPP